MDTRVQFRISEETKRLAQAHASEKGTTLSDECRKLTESLADQQRSKEGYDSWLRDQVNAAFDKMEAGESTFLNTSESSKFMEERKEAIRKLYKSA